MPNRERVIYDIERCICHVPDACRDCSKYIGAYTPNCMEQLLADALELLKEQEPHMMKKEAFIPDPDGLCPICKWPLYPEDNPHYCGNCGQAVKWDET